MAEAAKKQDGSEPNFFGGFGALPEMTRGMTFTEIGNSGLRAFAGWVREEFLPQLVGRQGARVYREMSDNSAVIGGILFSIISTMRKVEWRTVAADDTPQAQEMADFADSLRDDMSHTWEDAIVEGLSMLTYGFAPQEIVYKRRNGRKPGGDRPASRYDDGRIGWRKLPIRGQDTVIKWFFDRHGTVMGMTQQPYVGPLIDLPIEKLLLFRPTQHKGNPEGRSILRTAYRSYYFSKRIEEQEAILYERMNGIPVIKVPAQLMEAASSGDGDATSVINALKNIAVNLRIDEQMGILIPSDPHMSANGQATTIPQYSIELVTPQSGRMTVNATETLNRHHTNMMIAVLADFLQLGHESRGTQALAVSKQDLFFQAVEGFLNSMAAVYNRHGLARIWALNGLDEDLRPEYAPDLAQRIDLDVLSNFILRTSQAGMMWFPDQGVESALKDSAGLPDIEDVGLGDLGDQGKEPPVNPQDGTPDLAATNFGKIVLGSLARRMRKHEGPKTEIRTRLAAAERNVAKAYEAAR